MRGCRITNVGVLAESTTAFSLKTLVARQAVVVQPNGTANNAASGSDVVPVEDGGSVLLQALVDVAGRPRGDRLSALNLAHIAISSISGLQTLKHLTTLSLVMSEEMDWSPLLALPNLAYLNQHGDCIVETDQWDVLAALPALRVLHDPVAISDDQALTHVEQLIVSSFDDDMCPGLCDWPRLTSVK